MSIERGQIYFVNLNPVQGREQAGSLSDVIERMAREKLPKNG